VRVVNVNEYIGLLDSGKLPYKLLVNWAYLREFQVVYNIFGFVVPAGIADMDFLWIDLLRRSRFVYDALPM
jgi:hypothetical protein